MIAIPVILESIKSLKDKTFRVVFSTNELTPQQLTALGVSLQHFGYMAFKKEEFTQDELDLVDSLKTEYDGATKSKSQRLRNVLHCYWKHEPKGYEVFDDFYNHHMERFINHVKSKLPNLE